MPDDQHREERGRGDRGRRRFAAPGHRNGRGAEHEQRRDRERVVPVGEDQQEGAEQIARENAAGDQIEAAALRFRSVEESRDDEGRGERKARDRVEGVRRDLLGQR